MPGTEAISAVVAGAEQYLLAPAGALVLEIGVPQAARRSARAIGERAGATSARGRARDLAGRDRDGSVVVTW